jgi:hypothetical protein
MGRDYGQQTDGSILRTAIAIPYMKKIQHLFLNGHKHP